MYLKIYFIGVVLATFHLQSHVISGTFIVTESPARNPLHIPNLIKLPQSRTITIYWVKVFRFCGDVFFARHTGYPLTEDFHVFFCRPDNQWKMRIGIWSNNMAVAHADEFPTPEAGNPLYEISILFDDDSNSLTVLQGESHVILNYTAKRKSNDFREFQWYALSGDAHWDTFTDEF